MEGPAAVPLSFPASASLCGDAFCAGEVRGQELSGSVQGGGGFVEDRGVGLEDVRDSGVMSRVTVTSAVAARRARRTASSRRTSWVPAWMIRGGRPVRSPNIGLIRGSAGSARRVVGDPGLEVFPAEQRVGLALVSRSSRPGSGRRTVT